MKGGDKLQALHKEMDGMRSEYKELEKSITIRYPPTWASMEPLSFKLPDLHIKPKAIPYPLGSHDPTITWGMTGGEFDQWAESSDPWKTTDLVEAIRALVTNPGDDYKGWNDMGGMGSDGEINIPQLDVDPSKDSTTMYPPSIIRLLDAIVAN